jgi:hypothetical protein
MNPETEARLNKVVRYSTSLKNLFRFLFVVLVLASLVTLVLLFTSYPALDLDIGSFRFDGENVAIFPRLFIAVGTALYVGIGLKLMWHLIRLFDLYANRQIFTADNVKQIRQIGISLLLLLPVNLYFFLIQTLVFGPQPTDFSPDSQSLTISLTPPFPGLVAGFVIIVVSWIMDVGRELREEQDLTV